MQTQYSDVSLVQSLFGSHLCLKGQTLALEPRDLQDPLESMPGFSYCRKITPGGLNLAKGFCFCLKTSGTVTCSYSCLHMGTPLQLTLKILSDLILTPGINIFMDREINIHSRKGPGGGKDTEYPGI